MAYVSKGYAFRLAAVVVVFVVALSAMALVKALGIPLDGNVGMYVLLGAFVCGLTGVGMIGNYLQTGRFL